MNYEPVLHDKLHVLRSRHWSVLVSAKGRSLRFVPSLFRFSLLCGVSLLRHHLGLAKQSNPDTTTQTLCPFPTLVDIHLFSQNQRWQGVKRLVWWVASDRISDSVLERVSDGLAIVPDQDAAYVRDRRVLSTQFQFSSPAPLISPLCPMQPAAPFPWPIHSNTRNLRRDARLKSMCPHPNPNH